MSGCLIGLTLFIAIYDQMRPPYALGEAAFKQSIDADNICRRRWSSLSGRKVSSLPGNATYSNQGNSDIFLQCPDNAITTKNSKRNKRIGYAADFVRIEDKVVKSVQCKRMLNISVGRLIHDSLVRLRNKPLLINGDTNVTWRGVDILRATNRLTRSLLEYDLRAGDVVSLYVSDAPDILSIATLAVIFAGRTVAGSDESDPYDEAYGVAVTANVTHLIVSSHNEEMAVRLKREIPRIRGVFLLHFSPCNSSITLKPFYEMPLIDLDVEIPVKVDPEKDIALVAFSSGTTGRPKAALISHRSLVQEIGWTEDYPQHRNNPDIRHISARFDNVANLNYFLSCLYEGAKCVTPIKYGSEMLSFIEKQKISSLYVTPSTLVDLFEAKRVEGRFDISSLKEVIVSGSALYQNVVDNFMKAFPSVKYFRQEYGSTEMGFVSIKPKYMGTDNMMTVGLPFPGSQYKIIDRNTGLKLGPHQVGEIYAKTRGQFSGYIEKENELHDYDGLDGFVKSGDAGYYDEQGFLYVSFRYKEVIKVDGMTVSPWELEEILSTHDLVKESAVLGVEQDFSDETTKAFVVLRQGQSINESELIEYVNSRVASYKHITGGIVFLNHMPKTIFGKIDKQFLRQFL